jgi:hypothetical protein
MTLRGPVMTLRGPVMTLRGSGDDVEDAVSPGAGLCSRQWGQVPA